jgi:hypothetical protein
VGGNTGGTSCVTAVRNGTGPASADGTIDTSLVGPNGDQLGTFNFRTRGLSLRNNDTREIVADANGDFYIVGECDGQMCVYKFRADGALDTGPCVLMPTQMDVSLLRPTVWQLFATCWACRSR